MRTALAAITLSVSGRPRRATALTGFAAIRLERWLPYGNCGFA